jgi:hypothetical protein
MRIGSYVAIGLATVVMTEVVALAPSVAVPFHGSLTTSTDNLERAGDNCWWWGTRWQYGWRGYGWYPCWDWPKPAPTVVAPEATPDQAPVTESCEQTWHDAAGRQHWRRMC